MSITFQCQSCRKEVTAPDAAGGKKGKCPFCGEMNEIPLPPEAGEDDDGLIPLAPIDEEAERREREERRNLYAQEQNLLAESGGTPPVPLEHRDDLTSEELHHFVVNYCLDMAEGKLDRAQTYVAQLKGFGALGTQAVEDFASGTVDEPALKQIPQPVLQAFLKQLTEQAG